MRRIRVELEKRIDESYDIHLSADFIEEMLTRCDDGFFLADSAVYAFYEELFQGRKTFVLETSEKSKSMESFIKVLEFLHDNGCRRDGKLIAVGGGITGDLGGFAAASYMRGIDYVQVPTTLLSMVDSSVGGKTGINFLSSKNNVGAFHQPQAVYIDTDFLRTLDDEEYLNGLAEVIKYGALFSAVFFDMLLEKRDAVLERKADVLLEIISECCRMKAEVVKEDEKEQGVRKLLNFGHTFGHAIETDSGFAVKHGFAVAAGMYLENLFGLRQGYCSEESVNRLGEVLDAYGFEKEYKIKDTDVFFSALSADKKADKKGLTIVFAPEIGKGEWISGIKPGLIKDFFG
ncbi:3-dehydroquinate synthase [Geovibrio thiophilus]|uniref:3-dehydroquinate synthase n=1 Tax=Geovibrio thiophilus TaxID=139438 RepID=A0A3R5V2Y3_9BACT|nr:3-dehydroquinate synthase [Geovibrio thiophilus]QAR34279.1 3-dehydroquinate synthase [Geovibrio thiophilus]